MSLTHCFTKGTLIALQFIRIVVALLFTIRTGPTVCRSQFRLPAREVVEKRMPRAAVITNDNHIPLAWYVFGRIHGYTPVLQYLSHEGSGPGQENSDAWGLELSHSSGPLASINFSGCSGVPAVLMLEELRIYAVRRAAIS